MSLTNPHPCTLIAIADNIEVQIVEHTPKIDKSVEEAVNEAWKEAEKAGKTNGRVIGFLDYAISPEGQVIINAYIGQYKHFYVPRTNPEIKKIIKPIGVCGVISDAEENYLIGRRNQKVTQYPGHLEFPPSGGLNVKDMDGSIIRAKDSLLREFCEETVFAPVHIKNLKPMGLLLDQNDEVYDIAFSIKLKTAFSSQANLRAEYAEEIIAPLKRIPQLLENDLSVPTMPILCRTISLLQ